MYRYGKKNWKLILDSIRNFNETRLFSFSILFLTPFEFYLYLIPNHLWRFQGNNFELFASMGEGYFIGETIVDYFLLPLDFPAHIRLIFFFCLIWYVLFLLILPTPFIFLTELLCFYDSYVDGDFVCVNCDLLFIMNFFNFGLFVFFYFCEYACQLLYQHI